jgi:hypothetical protein
MEPESRIETRSRDKFCKTLCTGDRRSNFGAKSSISVRLSAAAAVGTPTAGAGDHQPARDGDHQGRNDGHQAVADGQHGVSFQGPPELPAVPQLADQKTGQDVDAGDQDAGYRTGNPHREFHKLDSFVVLRMRRWQYRRGGQRAGGNTGTAP